jgi:hypothetical protein
MSAMRALGFKASFEKCIPGMVVKRSLTESEPAKVFFCSSPYSMAEKGRVEAAPAPWRCVTAAGEGIYPAGEGVTNSQSSNANGNRLMGIPCDFTNLLHFFDVLTHIKNVFPGYSRSLRGKTITTMFRKFYKDYKLYLPFMTPYPPVGIVYGMRAAEAAILINIRNLSNRRERTKRERMWYKYLSAAMTAPSQEAGSKFDNHFQNRLVFFYPL